MVKGDGMGMRFARKGGKVEMPSGV
jgi:hypothetical protein